MKVKEESKKADLKLSIQKNKIMASSPITLCKQLAKQWKTLTDFIFLGSKITTVTASLKLKGIAPWKTSYGKPVTAY